MERIKRIGLRGSFFLLALCGLAVSLVLLALLWQGCGAIAARYSNGGYIIGPGGLVERLPSPSPEEARLLELLGDIKLAGCIILPLLGLAGMLLFRHFHHFRNYRACKKGTIAGFAVIGIILAVFLLLLWRVVA